jgi:hypothetical protein
MGNLGDSLLLQHTKHMVEILIYVPTFIQRRAFHVANNTFDFDTESRRST